LSQDQQSRIIGAYLCGFKPLHIAQALSFPKSTVYNTVKQYEKTGSEHPNKRAGPHEVLSEHDKRALVRIANRIVEHCWLSSLMSLIFNLEQHLPTKPPEKVKGNMNSDSYVDQDLASVHTSEYSECPDLNPIENLWEHLDSAVRNKRPMPEK
ncbi:12178_t:CDS:2, partial [Gigaspora margarita]